MGLRHYKLYYEPSSTTKFYGTQTDLNQRIRFTGETIVRCCDGYWILSKPAVRIIIEYINNIPTKRHTTPDKYLYKTRKVKRITKQACDRLVAQLNSGEVRYHQLL